MEVRSAELGATKVRSTEICLAEIRAAEVCIGEAGPAEIRPLEVNRNVTGLRAPIVPDLRALLQDAQLMLVRHGGGYSR